MLGVVRQLRGGKGEGGGGRIVARRREAGAVRKSWRSIWSGLGISWPRRPLVGWLRPRTSLGSPSQRSPRLQGSIIKSLRFLVQASQGNRLVRRGREGVAPPQ